MKVFSLYVENIPKALHWKGLGHVFARYGDVVDVFIARKLSKAGKKFGFVRFKKQDDANRAIVSLNGFVLNGAKLSVSMAKFARGRAEWNRKLLGDIQGDIGKDDEEKYRTMTVGRNKGPCEEGIESRIKELVNQKIRKVLGHIEEADLRKLKRCLVGESSTGVSISIIQNKLIKRGLGDIKVQRLGGKLYLLSFEDDDLFLVLKELNWSHLKEIFSNVMPWSEDIGAWIDLHGWWCREFRYIVGITLQSKELQNYGARLKHSRGELEATKGTGREAPLLESSSESEEFQSTVRNGHIQGEEIDAINAIVLGKDYNESSLNDTRLLRGHVGDFQFMNNGLKVVKKKVTEDNKSSVETETSKQGEKEDLGSGSKSPRRSWGEVVQRNLESGSNSGTLNSVETITIRAREDLSDMELLNKQVGRPCDLSGKSDELRSFQVMM
ncbi:hypothetical protein V6N13_014187 [Hibiscus sabdariffa]